MKLKERLLGGSRTSHTEKTKPHQYPVSVNIITTEEDMLKTERLFASIPAGCEIVVVVSKPAMHGGGIHEEIVERTTSEKSDVVVVRREFEGDFNFADARNCAKRHSSREWIFWLDSDDEIISSNREILLHELEEMPAGVGGVFCSCSGIQKGLPGEQPTYYAIAHMRIFRNNPRVWWSGVAHEQIADALTKEKYTVQYSDLIIQHHGYNCEVDEVEHKLIRNVRGMSKELGEGVNDDIRRKGLEDLLYRDLGTLLSIRRYNNA